MDPIRKSPAAFRALFSAFGVREKTKLSSKATFSVPPSAPSVPEVMDPWGPLLQPVHRPTSTPEIVDPWGQTSTEGNLTTTQLQAVMPQLPRETAESYRSALNDAMHEFDITTPRRKAAFLAQIAYESGELRHLQERASGAAYEGRADLGNTQPGDGARFKGRGPIQLTGRHNYREAGRALGVDLEKHPDLVATNPPIAFRTAGWYWKSRRLNEPADRGDLRTITRRIQGTADVGAASRAAYYHRAQQALRT